MLLVGLILKSDHIAINAAVPIYELKSILIISFRTPDKPARIIGVSVALHLNIILLRVLMR